MMDGALAAVAAAFAWYTLTDGLTSHANERCAGRSAGFCEIEKSLDGYRLLGFNPADLLLFALFVVVLLYLLRRLASGVAGRIGEHEIAVPTWFGTTIVGFDQIKRTEIKPSYFGLVRSVRLFRRSGWPLAIWNFQASQAAEVDRAIQLIPGAPPATPPAT